MRPTSTLRRASPVTRCPTPRPSQILRLACLATLATAAACTDDAMPTAPPRAAIQAAVGATHLPAGRYSTIDEQFTDLAERIPGFGGYFTDDAGRFTIALVDSTRRALALQVLAPVLQERGLAASVVQVRPVQYDFAELNGWRDRARAVLAVRGVSTLDANEGQNRVLIGLVSDDARAGVEAALSRLNVPRAAVAIEVNGGNVPGVGLSDQTNNMVGGNRIVNQYGLFCTLGVNVRLPSDAGGGTEYFLTNGHCTTSDASMDGQVTSTTFSRTGYPTFAVEVDDPPLTIGSTYVNRCAEGLRCRDSDAARIQYWYPWDANYGNIARTQSAGTGTAYGSTTFNSAGWPYVYFALYGSRGPRSEGDRVDKVGVTTGWTSGRVRRTCEDTNVSRRVGSVSVYDRTLFCQVFVDATWEEGDSGSPAFTPSPECCSALLRGLVWGGRGDRSMFGYSDTESIQRELGTIYIHP